MKKDLEGSGNENPMQKGSEREICSKNKKLLDGCSPLVFLCSFLFPTSLPFLHYSHSTNLPSLTFFHSFLFPQNRNNRPQHHRAGWVSTRRMRSGWSSRTAFWSRTRPPSIMSVTRTPLRRLPATRSAAKASFLLDLFPLCALVYSQFLSQRDHGRPIW